MSGTELHHLLSRAIDGVVLHGESDRLYDLVRGLEQRAEQAVAAIGRVQGLRAIAPVGAQGPTWRALNLAIRDALDQGWQPTTAEPQCGAWGGCILPRGHNMGRADIPENHTTPAAWVDGDPLMEAIAAAVWEQCETEPTSSVVDDPRNIAAVAAAVARQILGTEQQPTTLA